MTHYRLSYDYSQRENPQDTERMMHVTVPHAPVIRERIDDWSISNTNKVVSIVFSEKTSSGLDECLIHLSCAHALALAGRLIQMVDHVNSDDGSVVPYMDELSTKEWADLFGVLFQETGEIAPHTWKVMVERKLVQTDGNSLGTALPPSLRK